MFLQLQQKEGRDNKNKTIRMARRPNTVSEILAPISWLNWLLGLGVFEIPLNKPRPYFSIIYDITLAVVYFAILYTKLSNTEILNNFDRMVYLFILLVNAAVAIACVINAWRNAKVMKEIQHKYTKLDGTLERLGMVNLRKSSSRNVLIYVTIWCTVMSILGIADHIWTSTEFKKSPEVFSRFSILLPVAVNFAADFTFTILVRQYFTRGLLRRLKKMNSLVKYTISNVPVKRKIDLQSEGLSGLRKIAVAETWHTRKNFVKEYLQVIKQIHLQITRLARLINQAYSIILLFELTVSFTIIAGFSYHLYLAILNLEVSDFHGAYKVFAIALWVSVVSLKVIAINYVCNSISQEIATTAQLLRDINGVEEDAELRDLIQQLCMQLILHPIYFTASGFVRLDNNCTKTFFATVGTYMVILIQVRNTPGAIKSLRKRIHF